jgi:hypothetical protein
LPCKKSARESVTQHQPAQKKKGEAHGQSTGVEGGKREPLERPAEELQTARSSPTTQEQERLERRVKELEISKAAQEDATRSIIGDALSTLGSKINEYVVLG